MRFVVASLVAVTVLAGPRASRAEPPPAPAPAAAPATPVTAVNLTVRVVNASCRAARSLRLLEVVRRKGKVASVDPAALGCRIECWAKAGHVEPVTAPRVTAYAGQKATISVLEQISYVADFEAEVGRGGHQIADPVVQTIQAGVLLDVTGTPRGSGVDLDAAFTWSEVKRPMETYETTHLAGGAKVTIQIPEMRVRRVKPRMVVPPGRAVLLADFESSLEPGRHLLAWAEASTVRVDSLAPSGFTPPTEPATATPIPAPERR